MLKLLKEAYEKESLYYWCNSTGEINMPGYRPLATPEPEVLPPLVKTVYDNFWAEGRGALEYVVTYNGETGLMLVWHFSISWLKDLNILNRENEQAVLSALSLIVRIAAEALADEQEHEVLYGEHTDPDGDEILLFLPLDDLTRDPNTRHFLMDNHGEAVDAMGKRLYATVEEELRQFAAEQKNKQQSRFSIVRENQTYDLSRQELHDAAEAYERLVAEEVVSARLAERFGEDALPKIVPPAVEEYLRDKRYGCNEDFCLMEAMNAAQTALDKE